MCYDLDPFLHTPKYNIEENYKYVGNGQ